MDLVLFGIQGSGKGTLGKIVAEKYGFEIFETGSELRKLGLEASPLAKKVRGIIESGLLVPNEVVMDIIENFMSKLEAGKKVLFDGIPRKLVQAETFDALMKKLGRDFIGILVDVPEEVAIKRLSTRRLCEICKTVYPASYSKNTCEKDEGKLITRSDDVPASIRTRIMAYFTETMPVIKHYRKNNKMLNMNGDMSIEDAKIEIIRLIDTDLKGKL